MRRGQLTWTENKEFAVLVERLIAREPEDFGEIDANSIIAYNCTNAQPPEGKPSTPFRITGCAEPEVLISTKTYLVKFFASVWDNATQDEKLEWVRSALRRIDPEHPGCIRTRPQTW